MGTLQAAVTAASAGDELVLKDGTYTGSSENVLLIGKNLTVRAQRPGMAILDGRDARRVIQVVNGTVNFEGLIITKGRTSNGRGGGVRISGGIVSFTNCVIHSNTASNRGGGLRITGGIVTLIRCEIHSNTVSKKTGPRGGGVFINSGAIVHFQSCIIRNNLAISTGGAVFISGSTTHVDFQNCSIYDNSATGGYAGDGNGGGLSITGGTVNVVSSTIRNNKATSNSGGGIYINAGEVTLHRCNIHHNEAKTVGGGVAISQGRLHIIHSQVNHNKASDGGALMVSSTDGKTHVEGNTHVAVKSTALYNNDSPQIKVVKPAFACGLRVEGRPLIQGVFDDCPSD